MLQAMATIDCQIFYLFYSCLNTALFHTKHGPQMAPESTVSVPKEIPGSFFSLIFFQEKKSMHTFCVLWPYAGHHPIPHPFFPFHG